MDARDRYDALEWALKEIGERQDVVERLLLQTLQNMRDDAKREAGR